MSDGAISQDEIDALLSGVNVGGGGGAVDTGVSADTAVLSGFASGLKDKLAADLNTMTGASFSAGNPVIESVGKDQFLAKLPEMVIAVTNDFSNALVGEHLYVLSHEFAKKLTGLINHEQNVEIDDMALSVVSEIVSKHTGNEITELEKTGRLKGIACSPAEALNVPKAVARIPQNTFTLFSYPLMLEGQAYTLWEAVGSDVASGIANALGAGAMSGMGGVLSAADMAAMGSLAGGGAMPQMGGGVISPGMNIPNVQSLQFPSLQGGAGAVQQGNIGLIMDVFMEMTVELGRTKKQIKDILVMGEGTIIELDKLAGEPVDILVNHKPIAKGEVVVIDENFGVRVTEILSPMERVSTLS
ncbi:flagellar motor switch protein FliN [Treponema parvum]|uniref:Flagellar motor switch protein FliN n=1 Tax=Treponema parvum TaxID=138851 RepID=A0A975EZY0_9SPIR|nr:flagellar motor switch protein FliN [Treponema parvum]QTQ11740.1 flagellar motor switch protein FliN [Treponema parvum]QTQ14106.1 flagellar motor switch protein FliN [Treponema parvum]QTQ16315.1 flagellar motor switch protein FliN [Treponema parvum]